MSTIMSQNGRKITKIMHNAEKNFDWGTFGITVHLNNAILKYTDPKLAEMLSTLSSNVASSVHWQYAYR